MVGDGYILVGDACFVDRFLFGVHLALMAGVLAAAYVTTVLKDPSMQEAAGRVYKEMYYRNMTTSALWPSCFMRATALESYFWEARRLLGAEEHLSPRTPSFVPWQGSRRAAMSVVLEHGQAPARL